MLSCLTYSIKEAAFLLGVSKSKMYNLVHENAVPNIKLGKVYLIPVKEFHNFLNQSIEGGN